MQAKGFFKSLFDYSFGSFVTPRIISILYLLATILISLWTLLLVVAAFNVSDGAGGAMLIVGGPLFWLISMIYARVLLELIIVLFRINGNVKEIRDDLVGDAPQPAPLPETPPVAAAPVITPVESPPAIEPEPAVGATAVEPSSAPPSAASSSPSEPASAPPAKADVRYCENCGAERSPEGRFCTSCGHA